MFCLDGRLRSACVWQRVQGLWKALPMPVKRAGQGNYTCLEKRTGKSRYISRFQENWFRTPVSDKFSSLAIIKDLCIKI